jgi:hypothetical protein
MTFDRKEGETAQAWYQRLKPLGAQLEVALRQAKREASEEINQTSALRKLARGRRLMASETAAFKRIPRERLLDLQKEIQ